MAFMQKHRGKIVWTLLVLLALSVAFFCGEKAGPAVPEESLHIIEEPKNENTEMAAVLTPSPLAAPIPAESPREEVTKNEKEALLSPTPSATCAPALTCTLSVRCDIAVQARNTARPDLPADGIIYAETTVSFTEGESVFDILLREMREKKIHLEFETVPLYNSVYIEGIQNLYAYDFGELSGWMYKVNGAFPGKSCSEYIVCAGDRIEWVYTCDMGKDVGSIPATETQKKESL